MRKIVPLTNEQKNLVEENLSVVSWVIWDYICCDRTTVGMEYEDLYQEGCCFLCQAAASYQPDSVPFAAYARKVVRNGLISYCRKNTRLGKSSCHLEINERGDLVCEGDFIPASDLFAIQADLIETLAFLEACKESYSGITRHGIEALAWILKGYELPEIAKMYGVPVTHVGAWISRSAQKLRQDVNFLSGISPVA